MSIDPAGRRAPRSSSPSEPRRAPLPPEPLGRSSDVETPTAPRRRPRPVVSAFAWFLAAFGVTGAATALAAALLGVFWPGGSTAPDIGTKAVVVAVVFGMFVVGPASALTCVAAVVLAAFARRRVALFVAIGGLALSGITAALLYAPWR